MPMAPRPMRATSTSRRLTCFMVILLNLLFGNEFEGCRACQQAGDAGDGSAVAAVLGSVGRVEFVVDGVVGIDVDESDVLVKPTDADVAFVAGAGAAEPRGVGPVDRAGVDLVAEAHHP